MYQLLLLLLGVVQTLEPIEHIDPPAAAGAMAPNLTVAGDTVLASWLEPVDPEKRFGPDAAYRLCWSRLTGASWSDSATIVEGTGFFVNWADVPVVTQGADGAILAHWLSKSGAAPYAYDVELARSTDRGRTWVRLGPVHDDGTQTEHGFVSMLPTSRGMRTFWLDGRETSGGHGHGSMALRTAIVDDRVRPSTVLDSRVCDCCSTSSAMTSMGPIIAYRDRSDEEVRDVSIVRFNGSGWTEPVSIHDDGWVIAGCPVNGPEIDADESRVVVAWYTVDGERPIIRVAFSSDAGRTFRPPAEIDGPTGSRSPIGRTDVVFRGESAIVTWISGTTERAFILGRRVHPNGDLGPERELAVTSIERASGFPKLVSIDGKLVLIWTDADAGRLRAVRFDDDHI